MRNSLSLPKQWKHWCKKAGLRVRKGSNPKIMMDWLYLQGHGREWRVNCYNMIQCGDTFAEFDRWALCDIRESLRPDSLSEFIDTVNSLIRMHEEKDVN